MESIKVKGLSKIESTALRRLLIATTFLPLLMVNVAFTLWWAVESITFLVHGAFATPLKERAAGRPYWKYLILSPIFLVVGLVMTVVMFPVTLVQSSMPLFQSAIHYWNTNQPLES